MVRTFYLPLNPTPFVMNSLTTAKNQPQRDGVRQEETIGAQKNVPRLFSLYMSRYRQSFRMDWQIRAMEMIEAHGFCDVDNVSYNSGNFNTIYMLSSLAKMFETNQLAENRYFHFQNLSTKVLPFQAPWKGIHLDTLFIYLDTFSDWRLVVFKCPKANHCGRCIVF